MKPILYKKQLLIPGIVGQENLDKDKVGILTTYYLFGVPLYQSLKASTVPLHTLRGLGNTQWDLLVGDDFLPYQDFLRELKD